MNSDLNQGFGEGAGDRDAAREYVVGLDAGGTRTRAVLAPAGGGEPRGEGVAGPGNALTVPVPELTDHLAEALERAVPAALRGRVVAVAGGFAGASRTAADEPGRVRANAALTAALHRLGIDAASVEIHSDIEAAFASAPGHPADGLALVAGTGAVAARITGRACTATAGGDGWLLGDDGSGFWLGREAVRAALRMADGRGGPTVLAASVGRALGLPEEVLPGGDGEAELPLAGGGAGLPQPGGDAGLPYQGGGAGLPHGGGEARVSQVDGETGQPDGGGGGGRSGQGRAPGQSYDGGDAGQWHEGRAAGRPCGGGGEGRSDEGPVAGQSYDGGDAGRAHEPRAAQEPNGVEGAGRSHGCGAAGRRHGGEGARRPHGAATASQPDHAATADQPGHAGAAGRPDLVGAEREPDHAGPAGRPAGPAPNWTRAQREAYRMRLLPAVMDRPPVHLARLAPLVAEAARGGDAVAEGILDEAAGHLAGLVRALGPRSGERVVATGGLLGPDGPLTAPLTTRLRALGLTLDWVADGSLGAVALARLSL